ncbi:MAG: restriction endonuclease subunit S [Methylovulum sp.]|nr:restriction endonuclease subunit S [Methylovulum sp.]MCF8008019.1 restriction endonuclease subunit S [Methylovulum sp.]
MSEWRAYKLEELGTLQRGRSRHRPRYAFHLYGGKYPFIQTGEIRAARKYIREYEQTYNEAGLEQSKLWSKNTLCITIAANIAELAILSFDSCFPDSVLGFIPNKDVNLNFIYYTLVHFQNELKHIGEGSVQDNINLGTFQNISFPIPELPEQKAIAAVLSSLDDKIDLLHRQNKTLETMAETLFRQWFVVDAQDDWEDGKLGDVIDIFDGQRIPLSKMERDKKKTGVLYPYYGAAQIMDYINGYIFDGEYILLGEDGTVRTDEGYPILQYATGKFWVNNHTHVLKAKLPYSNFFLWNYLSKKNIDEIVTGAVQPKINQGNLKALGFPIFPENLIIKFNQVSEPMLAKIQKNKAQIKTIEKLRDNLLPKLMSGEVRMKLTELDHVK